MDIVDSYTRFHTFLDDLVTVSAADVQRVAQTYLVETNRTVGWFVPTETTDGGQIRDTEYMADDGPNTGRFYWPAHHSTIQPVKWDQVDCV
jgi:hypothetical protein